MYSLKIPFTLRDSNRDCSLPQVFPIAHANPLSVSRSYLVGGFYDVPSCSLRTAESFNDRIAKEKERVVFVADVNVLN